MYSGGRARAGETVGSLPVSGSLVPLVPVQAAEDLSWPLLEGETLETELELTQTSFTAPTAAGTQVGVLRGYVNGAQVGEVPWCAQRLCPAIWQSRRFPFSACWAGYGTDFGTERDM